MKVEFSYVDGKPSIVLRAETPEDSGLLQIIGDKQPVSARVTNGEGSPAKTLTVEFGAK
jgi:hypothetical protein